MILPGAFSFRLQERYRSHRIAQQSSVDFDVRVGRRCGILLFR